MSLTLGGRCWQMQIDQALIDSLPSLEELERKGPATGGRSLTADEQRKAQVNKKKKRKNLETKAKSEALCKRQLISWGGTGVVKNRDDSRNIRGQEIRISTDVDYRGTIPIRINGMVLNMSLRVESKGITLTEKVVRYEEDGSVTKTVRGSFSMANLSDKQRTYLQDAREEGKFSAIHLAWWLNGDCIRVNFIPWKWWPELEKCLAERAKKDKRFRGKSLRYHADLDLLDETNILKVNGRWTFEPGHWLPPLLAKGEQPILF